MSDSEKNEVDYKTIQFAKEIGEGSFGKVHLAKWNDRLIAVKDLFSTECSPEKLKREQNQLSKVRHKNIVEFYGVSYHNSTTYLLMEFIEGGSLHKFLYGPRKNEHQYFYALDWAHQIAQGLAYMHCLEEPIIHRDIKPHNILLSRQRLSIKICDFGTATNPSTSVMTNESGTPIYMAPEVYDSSSYTEKCDVYSFGITLWEMMAMLRPFAQETNIFLLQCNIQDGDRPSFGGPMKSCPLSMKELITSCWDKEPTKRPSMTIVAKELKDSLSNTGF